MDWDDSMITRRPKVRKHEHVIADDTVSVAEGEYISPATGKKWKITKSHRTVVTEIIRAVEVKEEDEGIYSFR